MIISRFKAVKCYLFYQMDTRRRERDFFLGEDKG